MNFNDSKKRIVIIGAGVSGLVAAYYLLRKIHSYAEVVLVEKSGTAGGSAKNVVRQNMYIHSGRQFFDFDSPIFKDISKNITEISAITGRKNLEDLRDTYIKTADSLIRIEDLKKPRKNAAFRTLTPSDDSKTLEDYWLERFSLKQYEDIFEPVTEKICSEHPLEMPLENADFLTRWLNPAGGGGNQLVSMKSGAGEFLLRLEREVVRLGGRIIKNCEVKKVIADNDKISSIECCASGQKKRISLDFLLSTIPINDFLNRLSGADISESISETSENVKIRAAVRVWVKIRDFNFEKELKFKSKNTHDVGRIIVPDRNVKMSDIEVYKGNSIWLGAGYFCGKGDIYWGKSSFDFCKIAVEELCALGLIKLEDVLRVFDYRNESAFFVQNSNAGEIRRLTEFADRFENFHSFGPLGKLQNQGMNTCIEESVRAVKWVADRI